MYDVVRWAGYSVEKTGIKICAAAARDFWGKQQCVTEGRRRW